MTERNIILQEKNQQTMGIHAASIGPSAKGAIKRGGSERKGGEKRRGTG